ncbi:alpha/beta fold hydrolase [Flagellimonas allohymeniacidonis]|uniref:Alpha/beta hydrolase n=1 Tax=Flagellimonas allohymeniacidonis TaxID=2517819 RepID=A0A4Q8QGJ7_9FLAO|nr:alpha/beta hydrolase [Allomuricauda hymeniacidonis]TAI49611.1 alpha/beta hydrolase [Allomuricauda hymeniacidonis]
MKKLLTKIIPRIYGKYFNLLVVFDTKRTAQKAFNTFCKIRKGRVTEQQKPFLEAAKKEVEAAAGHQIQVYEWQGSKPTVMLVHGWESNSFRWRNLIKKLQEADFHIIAFDAPGHGYSTGHQLYVPLYSECLQALIEKHQPQFLVGHSVGGMTLLYNDFKNQNEFIQKIVTIGSPSEFHEIMTHYQGFLRFNDKVLNALDAFIQSKFDMRIKDFSSSKFVATNTKKGLLFHDRLDLIAPYHASEQVHQNWKGSQLVSTEGLGHSMHQEEVNNQIIQFLEA